MPRRHLAIALAVLVSAAACDNQAPQSIPTQTAAPDAASPASRTPPAHGGMRDQSPTWSPDGSRIAFTTNPGPGGQIWLAKADGTGQPERLVGSVAVQPAWSPDGRRIAFTSLRSGNWDIHLKDIESGIETRVTTHELPDWAPAWSPDGSRLAFYRFDEAKKQGSIWTIGVDGSDERLLAAERNEQMPYWSPDGTRIAFQSDRDGNWEIYVMQADGTGQTRVTVTPDRHDGEPAWTPDGAWIVFSAGVGQARDIYAIRPNGSGERQLTRIGLEV